MRLVVSVRRQHGFRDVRYGVWIKENGFHVREEKILDTARYTTRFRRIIPYHVSSRSMIPQPVSYNFALRCK